MRSKKLGLMCFPWYLLNKQPITVFRSREDLYFFFFVCYWTRDRQYHSFGCQGKANRRKYDQTLPGRSVYLSFIIRLTCCIGRTRISHTEHVTTNSTNLEHKEREENRTIEHNTVALSICHLFSSSPAATGVHTLLPAHVTTNKQLRNTRKDQKEGK